MLTLKHKVFNNRVLASDETRKVLAKIFRRQISKEAESAQIYTDDRDLAIAELSATTQNRTIASHDHCEVGVDFVTNVLFTRELTNHFNRIRLFQFRKQRCPRFQNFRAITSG